MSKVFDLIEKEQHRQNTTIELIASENFVSDNILKAVGSCLTNKYAEGYPYKRTSGNIGRYYGGTFVVDELEEYCCDKFREAFHTDYHVNVQPHSGSQANFEAYMSVLKPGDTILSMSLDAGGHLSHSAPVNFVGKLFNVIPYGLGKDGLIDYEQVRELALEYNPQMIVCGASAYPREIDFKRFKEIADEVGAYCLADIAHIAGLVATGFHNSPFGLMDFVTMTTHKTFRSTRGGVIFCKPEFAKKVDSAVFPMAQGGPLCHIIAGKAIGAEEACTPEYRDYIRNVVINCAEMAGEFKRLGYKLVTGGTDNHLLLLDLSDLDITGKELQDKLDEIGITLNKNCVPNEKRSPKETSGVRIGTAAMTTKGFTAEDFIEVAQIIDKVIKGKTEGVAEQVQEILKRRR